MLPAYAGMIARPNSYGIGQLAGLEWCDGLVAHLPREKEQDLTKVRDWSGAGPISSKHGSARRLNFGHAYWSTPSRANAHLW